MCVAGWGTTNDFLLLSYPSSCGCLMPNCVTLWPFLGTGAFRLLWARYATPPPPISGHFYEEAEYFRQRRGSLRSVCQNLEGFQPVGMTIKIILEKNVVLLAIAWPTFIWERKGKSNKVRDSLNRKRKMIFSNFQLLVSLFVRPVNLHLESTVC